MSISALTGQDVLIINGRQMRNFSDADTIKIESSEPLTQMTTGKNQNTIYAYSYKGKNMKLECRFIIGSSDDQFLIGLLQQYNQNPPAFNLMTMEYDKVVGDGLGNLSLSVYLGTGMTFEFQPGAMENVAGDTNQATRVWKFVIANVNLSVT